MPDQPFFIEDQPADHDLHFLADQINQNNMEHVGAFDGRGLAIFVRNEQYAIIAGISGYTWAAMCEIEFLWVHPDLQGQGLGSRLLQAAEDEARRRNCSIVILGSYSFQAPVFYQRHGYELAGQIDDCPPGHTNYYFKKYIQQGI
jgi:GNAT superfamily N-acetyltransferase